MGVSTRIKTILKTMLGSSRQPANTIITRTFSSYSEALAACINGQGYNDHDIPAVVAAKTQKLSQKIIAEPMELNASDAFALLPFLKFSGAQMSVIDVGGACGAHYLYVRQLLPVHVKLKWIVVETDAMCLYARQFENEELSFEADLNKAIQNFHKSGSLDLVYTSGTIQCLPDPEPYVRLIADSGASMLFFGRLGLTRGSQSVIANHKSRLSHNGVGTLPEGFTDRDVEYPFTFIPKRNFDLLIASKYKYDATWLDSTGVFPVNQEPIVGLGILASLKK